MIIRKLTILSAIISLFTVSAATAGTLDTVKGQGFFNCGVSQGVPGFSNPDSDGNWSGIDVDVCRAVSAAIFGTPDNVKYVPLTAKERFTALQSGEIDVLSRNTTWTLSRDAQIGLEFAGVNFYDGQGFMVRNDSGITSAMELDGASVCTNLGTTTELNMADFFRANGMSYEPVVFEKADEVVNAYDEGRCDTYTTDKSGLAAQRTKLADPDAHVVLPETISKEPLGPVVREGDATWADVVRWSLNVWIEAEEYGVNSGNIDSMMDSKNPAIQRIVGAEGTKNGAGLNLDQKWSYNLIKQVGNYAESYKRNLADTGIMPDRGPNALWTNGGILYVPPVR